MKPNSLNPFDLILGRTLKQKLEKRIKKLEDQILSQELEMIRLEGEKSILKEQISFIGIGEFKPDANIGQLLKTYPKPYTFFETHKATDDQ